MASAAGFSIVVSVADQASAKIDAISHRIASLVAPFERVGKSLEHLGRVSGLDAIGRRLGDIARAGLQVFESLGRIVAPLGAITGVASLGGMYALVSRWGELGERLSFVAERIGIFPAQLSALEGAARLAGAPVGAMSEAMKSLTDNLNAAAGGRAPEFVGLLYQMKIDLYDANHHLRTANQILPEFIDKLGTMADPANKARAAAMGFGGAADKIWPVINEGSAALARNIAQAKLYLGVTDESTKRAGELHRSQTSLVESVEGLGNAIADKLAPRLGPLLEQMATWIAANKDWIATRIDEAVGRFVTWIESIPWKDIIAGVEGFFAGVNKIVQAIGGWQTAAEGLFVFIVGRWTLGILASVAQIATAITGVGAALTGITTRLSLAIGLASALGAGLAYVLAPGMRRTGQPTMTQRMNETLQNWQGTAVDLAQPPRRFVSGPTPEHPFIPAGPVPVDAGKGVSQLWQWIFGTPPDPNSVRRDVFDWIFGPRFVTEAVASAPRPGYLPGAAHMMTHHANTLAGHISAIGEDALNYFKSVGWSHAQSAGIVANLQAESGLQAHGPAGDSGQAKGIAQWHPDRQATFARWAGHPLEQSTWAEQLAFVNYELTQGAERRAGDYLKRATNAAQAGAIVSGLYERPADVWGNMQSRAQGAAALDAATGPPVIRPRDADAAAASVPVAKGEATVKVILGGAVPPGTRTTAETTGPLFPDPPRIETGLGLLAPQP